jgi:hypothetical protein
MAGAGDDAGRKGPVSGDEHGAHAADPHAGGAQGQLGTVADQGAADFAAFDDDLALFSGQPVKAPVRRDPGRPLGSRNRLTSKVREYLLHRGYRDPLEQAAALVTADPRELAAALAGKAVNLVTFGEALAVLAEQGKARGQLLPYFHQEQPKPKEPERETERHVVIIVDSHEKAQAVQQVIEGRAIASQTDDGGWIAEPVEIADDFSVREHD